MLLPADQQIVDREPGLPGLSALLDPQAMLALLQQRWPGRHFAAPMITYLRYKPDTSCLAGYSVTLDGETLTFSANARRADASEKLEKVEEKRSERSRLGPGRVLFPSHSITLVFSPNDRRLRKLKHLADPEKQKRLLAALGLPEDCQIAPIRHRPERRFVGQILHRGEPIALLKLYRDAAYAQSAVNSGAFGDAGSLRVPRCLGESETYHAVATQWLAGPAVMPGPGEAARIGATLAALHAQRPVGLSTLTREDQVQAIRQVADAVADLSPELGKDAHRVVDQIALAISRFHDTPVAIHGDFYLAQLIDMDDAIGIVDFDESAMGPAGWDLGNIIGHLIYGGGSGTAEFGAEMLRGYRDHGGRIDEAELAGQVAISLLRLAAKPFRDRHPAWPDAIASVIARAEQMLSGGSMTAAPFDPAMPMIEAALDPETARRYFVRASAIPESAQITSAMVVRHKPGRRAMLAYQSGDVHLLAKMRAKGVDTKSFALQAGLWHSDFGPEAGDGIRIPQPVAIVPRLGLWLQRRVDALPFDPATLTPQRAAQAIAKLHQSDVIPHKTHLLSDELRILETRLDALANRRPEWATRLNRVMADAYTLATQAVPVRPTPIHRDFYQDHLLGDPRETWIIDLDLMCMGDPAVDIGNFNAHLSELALRTAGDAGLFRSWQQPFATSSAHACPVNTRLYELLSLARLIEIDESKPERRATSEALLALCEAEFEHDISAVKVPMHA